MNDAPLESVTIHQGLIQPNLVIGGDREMVLTSGLVAATLVFYSWEIKAAVVGTLFWFFAIFVLRLMAKHDPKLRQVFMRHRLYRAYYPSHSTPWRDNPPSQARQYRDPWKIL